MSTEERPYIRHCGFCKQGMLRFMRCRECNAVCAVCDECELSWADVAEASKKAEAKSAGSFPACPHCGRAEARWDLLGSEDVERAKLGEYVAGRSE